MNQTLNSSGTPESALNHSRGSMVHTAYLVLSSLAMFTCLCGMAGNSTVIWLLGFRMRRTPFCIYILNLAAADLLFLFSMASMLSLETQPLANTTDKVHELMKRLKYFAYTAGLSLSNVVEFSSLTLFVRVRRSSQQRRRQPTRLFVVILASVLVFLICSLPLSIYWFVLYCSCASACHASPRCPPGFLGTVLQQALREEPELEGGETPTMGTNEMGA
uniref:MAS related GPR family member D n=1 Tax=Nomascus leucogenys TaxID=61853 RepID=G1R4B9_NOMLE